MYYNNCYGDWAAVRKTSNNFTQTNKVYGPSFDTIRKITGTKDEVAPPPVKYHNQARMLNTYIPAYNNSAIFNLYQV